MANWDLVRWLLNSNPLETLEFALLDLQDELSLHLIFDASNTWAFHFWSERFRSDDLINFISACLTSVDGDLHARLDVAASGNDSFYVDQGANHI